MKKLIYSQAQWIGKIISVDWDKVLHFQVGVVFNAMVFLLSFWALRTYDLFPALFGSFVIAIVATGFLGLTKELFDQKLPNNSFSQADMVATMYGAFLSSFILILLIIVK